LRFSAPLYLLLLIPVIAGLIYTWPRMRGMMKARKRFAFVLRFLLMSSLVIALAGPESYRNNHGLCTIFLLDRSDSIRDNDRKAQEQFVKTAFKHLGTDDEAGVVVFGKDAAVEAAPERSPNLGRVLSLIDGSATDVSAAIRLASASFPDGKARRMVLLSDGNETQGDTQRAAEVASSEGIPIDVVPVGSNNAAGEVTVDNVQIPNESRIGQPFQIRVAATSDTSTSGTLTIDRDGVEIKKLHVSLSPGENLFTIDETLNDIGFHRYRATLDAQNDHDPRNNVGMGYVAIRGKPKILLLQGKPSDPILANAIRQQDIEVEVGGPDRMPARADQLQNYDAVIFNDANAEAFTPTQMQLMRNAVRDSGIGFAMIGGENSFLPGGWFGTPVAEALPVDLNINKRVSFPSTSVLIICDTSGSMGMIEDGVTKVKLAAKAACFTIQMLSPADRAGVVASTDGIEFVAPMQQLTDKQGMMAQAMRMDVGGGGIYALPSMEFAIKNLEKETTKVRHLILLADGSDVDMRDGCFQIAARMRAEHITTSCVAIGDGQYVPFLKELAAVGGGRFYLALKGNQLPAVFTQDAATVSRSAIEEGAFLPKVAFGEPVLRGIDSESIPPLFAYCLTDARPLARVGMKTKKDDPLLAVWQYGLGTSLAFTSDAQPRWAAQWVPWGGFGTFWAQAVREISRRATSNHYQLATHLEGSKAVIALEARDENGNPINNLPAKVRVSGPDDLSVDVLLNQKAPGKYEGTFPASKIGSYIVSVAEPGGGGAQRISSSGFSLPYPPEYRSFHPNMPLIQGVANTTGGKELTNPADAFRGVPQPGHSIQELWLYFILFAALLLPLDVASRRIAIPVGEIAARSMKWLQQRKAAQQEKVVPERVEQLRRAKQRATTGTVVPPNGPLSQKPRVETPNTQRPTPNAPQTPVSTTSKLLDAKRSRKKD